MSLLGEASAQSPESAIRELVRPRRRIRSLLTVLRVAAQLETAAVGFGSHGRNL